MRRRFAATGVPTSARCRDRSSRAFGGRKPTTRCSCWMSVDKLGRDFRGDPASALLETLDPEPEFQLPGQLPGRSIRFVEGTVHLHGEHAGYGAAAAAGQDGADSAAGLHRRGEGADCEPVPDSAPDQGNGITTEQIEFPEDAVRYVVRHYTREAGVRKLEQRWARFAARRRGAWWKDTRKSWW